MSFFHVDGNSGLSEGQELLLRPHQNVWGDEALACYEDALPGGVSEWGDSWTYSTQRPTPNNPENPTDEEAQRYLQWQGNSTVELIFELVRQLWFPERPSRLQAVFAYDSIECAEDFRSDRCSNGEAPIYRLEASDGFRADGGWLRWREELPRVLAASKNYWNGLDYPHSLPYDREHLLTGKIIVAERVR